MNDKQNREYISYEISILLDKQCDKYSEKKNDIYEGEKGKESKQPLFKRTHIQALFSWLLAASIPAAIRVLCRLTATAVQINCKGQVTKRPRPMVKKAATPEIRKHQIAPEIEA